jgi:hypothetical protein
MNDDDLTTDLGRELHGRADAMYGASLALADVKGKARSIRRRRAATAVGGAVAAVALIVPTGAIASHQGHRTTPMPPATQSITPSPSPTATDGQQPLTGVLDVSDLPTGDEPKVDYVQDGTFHSPSAGTGAVRTRYTPVQFVWMADGARVWRTADSSGRPYVEIQDTDGAFHDPVRIGSDLSVNSAHSIVAWLTPSGQVTIWEGWASEPRPLGGPVPGSDLRVGPITGSADVAPGRTGPSCQQSSCTVIVNVRDGENQPWEVSESGSQPLLDGGYLSVSDVSDAGLSVGLTKITDFGSCSTLLGGGEFQGFRTCRHTLVSFSPDEQLLLADPAYHDGIGNGVIAMYDVGTGGLLFERHSTENAQSFYPEATWEDDTHVLMPVFQDGTWSLVRVASDGSMEYAVPPEPGEDMANPFVLPTGGGLAIGD